jgi:hypothetical protein
MGLRFYRRIPILGGLRLNVSRSGISTSIGRTGSWLTFGSRGARASVGIPGTGIGWTETSGRRGRHGVFLVVILIVVAVWLLH